VAPSLLPTTYPLLAIVPREIIIRATPVPYAAPFHTLRIAHHRSNKLRLSPRVVLIHSPGDTAVYRGPGGVASVGVRSVCLRL
jgi:hypothetical protein